MDNIAKEILKDREYKNEIIKSYLNLGFIVVSLKANTPGENKNTKDSHTLVSIFMNILDGKFYAQRQILNGYDGRMVLYLLISDIENLKNELVEIEENHPLGRMVDIDVYKESIPESRNHLRKCMLCENPAFVCARNKTHNIAEILNYIHISLKTYLLDNVKKIIDEAFMTELNLSPKFGLVCKNDNGCHKDMNYNTMVIAKDAIIDYLVKMFEEGYENDDLDLIFNNIRTIGKEAEQAMFLKTNNVNAYKGLIFILGITLASVSYTIRHDDVIYYEVIKEMTKDIYNDFNLESLKNTFGYFAYEKYGIKGVREEVHDGLIHVEEVVHSFPLTTNEDLYYALAYFISNISDTVLLKRCKDIDKYNYVKSLFKDFKIEDVDKLNEYAKSNNLSFGGSADLLVTSIFLRKFKQIINI